MPSPSLSPNPPRLSHTIPRLIFQHRNFTSQRQSFHQLQVPTRAKSALSSAQGPGIWLTPNLSATGGWLPNGTDDQAPFTNTRLLRSIWYFGGRHLSFKIQLRCHFQEVCFSDQKRNDLTRYKLTSVCASHSSAYPASPASSLHITSH